MGPVPGTFAGLSTWFVFLFNSGLAPVGVGGPARVRAAADHNGGLGLGPFRSIVDIAGVLRTGQLRSVILTVTPIAPLASIATGPLSVDSDTERPLFG